MAVHAKDHVYLESLHTISKASKLKPMGHRPTSRLIKAAGELSDLAKTFIIGKRQTQINAMKITTII
jgi:hypothetical protein